MKLTTLPTKVAIVLPHGGLDGGGIYTAYANIEPFLKADTRLHTRLITIDSIGFTAAVRAIAAASPHVVHVHGLWGAPSLLSLLSRVFFRTHTVVSPHGMLNSKALANSAWKKLLAVSYESPNLRAASYVHALTATEAFSVRELGLVNPIRIIPNGIRPPAIRALSVSERPLDGQGRRTMIYMGRFDKLKNLHALVETFIHDTKRYALPWRLLLVGWGHPRAEAALREAARGTDCVDVCTAVSDGAKDEVLRKAHLAVLPSSTEGLPMSVLECWSYRVPVAMTLVTELATAISLPVLRVDERRVFGLRQNCTTPIEVLSAEGDAGEARVANSYSAGSVALQFASLYRELAAN